MTRIKLAVISLFILVICYSCGVNGDPGHCYISIDWEYYNENYGVYYYEDNNPDVPEGINLERLYYYDSYPGTYDYYYESEDYENWYTYEGTYTLVQNPGAPARLFGDGMDGLDTYLDMYLYIRARKDISGVRMNTGEKGLSEKPLDFYKSEPVFIELQNWEEEKEGWKIIFSQKATAYSKGN